MAQRPLILKDKSQHYRPAARSDDIEDLLCKDEASVVQNTILDFPYCWGSFRDNANEEQGNNISLLIILNLLSQHVVQ